MTSSLSQPIHDVHFLYDLKTTMRDGVKLSSDVFLPKGGGKWPVVFLRTPYETLHGPHIEWAVWWASRGYACVIQDDRGRFESEGTFYAYHDDGRDGHDTLEWIANQPWCDGKIGMSGRSYGGIVQWQLAPLRSPYLTALAPQVIMGDYFSECHRIGGAVQWALTMAAALTFSTAVAWTQIGAAQIFGNQKFYRQLPLINMDVEAIGREIPFYRDWFKHQVYDDYWREIDTNTKLDQIDVPSPSRPPGTTPIPPLPSACLKACAPKVSPSMRARTRKYFASLGRTISPSRPNSATSTSAQPATSISKSKTCAGSTTGSKASTRASCPSRLSSSSSWARTNGALSTSGHSRAPSTRATICTATATPTRSLAMARSRPTRPPNEPPDRYEYDPDNPVPTLGGNNSTWTLLKFAADQVFPGPLDQRPSNAATMCSATPASDWRRI